MDGHDDASLCLLTCRLCLSMLTTILVSSHCTLRPTLRTPCCSSGSPFSQGRSSREEGRGMAAGKGKGRPERREATPAPAPAPGWGLESRRMESSGGNMLSRGSTTSGSHRVRSSRGWFLQAGKLHTTTTVKPVTLISLRGLWNVKY